MELLHKNFVKHDYMTCRPIIADIIKKATVSRSTKKAYININSAFDIETTKTENVLKEGGTKTGTYFSYTYCWQFHLEDVFVFGRDPKEFFDLVQYMNECIDSKKQKKKSAYRMVVYIHNLQYEYNNLYEYFKNMTDFLFIKNNTPLYITLQNVEFRCSFLLTHKPLRELGNEVGISKGEDFDYFVQRNRNDELTDEEIEYCFRDTYILKEWIKKEREKLGLQRYTQSVETTKEYIAKMKRYTALPPKQAQELAAAIKYLNEATPSTLDICKLPLTQTGYVRNDIKENFSNTWYGNQCKKLWSVSAEEYDFLHKCFRGGDTYGSQYHIGDTLFNLKHRDFCSAYPSFMVTEKFPVGKFTQIDDIDLERAEKIMEFDAVCLEVEYTNLALKEPYSPYIPLDKCDYEDKSYFDIINNRVSYADKITCYLTDIDYKIIKDTYEYSNINIKKFIYARKSFLPDSIVKLLFEYFHKKTVFKGKKDDKSKMEYQLAKQKLNAIFGCSAMALKRELYEVGNDGFTFVTEDSYSDWSCMPYQWALWITAYTRKYLNEFKILMGKNFVYGDTDSLFYIETPEVEAYIENYNKEREEKLRAVMKRLRLTEDKVFPISPEGDRQVLGAFVTDKGEEYCEKFATLGAKRYVTLINGKTEMTFSGLNNTKWDNRDKVQGKVVTFIEKELGMNIFDCMKYFKENPYFEMKLPFEVTGKTGKEICRGNMKGVINGEVVTSESSMLITEQETTIGLEASLKSFVEEVILKHYGAIKKC